MPNCSAPSPFSVSSVMLAFDDLNTNPAALDVLRRHDRPAEVKAGGAIDVSLTAAAIAARSACDTLLPDVRMIRRRKPILRYCNGAAIGDVAKDE